jgi:phosphatidylserine/phosphatidylglycerophosphate/cardiolipin synthase-like enzyme
MLPPDLVAAMVEARRRLTRESWQRLAGQLQATAGSPDSASVPGLMVWLPNPDAAWILAEAFHRHPGVRWNEIAAAMSVVDCLADSAGAPTDIIWSGPANGRFPIRRIDQVLYDLIAAATRRIMLVTFAAHRVPHLCCHLANAVQRGVALSMILEREDESEGQLTRDAFAAFRGVLAPHTHLYYWPLGKRERNQAGRPGKLHAKCAIIDDAALIGSANLTDDAFNRNMELGVLVHDRVTVQAIADHFAELIRGGELVRLKPEGS